MMGIQFWNSSFQIWPGLPLYKNVASFFFLPLFLQKLMPRSFHSCHLTALNSRLVIQAIIQRVCSISTVFLPPPPLLSPPSFHLSLGLRPPVSLRGGRNVSGPLPFRALVFRANHREMGAVREKDFACLRTAELSRARIVFNLCRLTNVFITSTVSAETRRVTYPV